jgi:hypothetical protein
MKSEETQFAIRMLTADDSPTLAALAGRDSAPVPTGQVLGASVDDRLVAAHSITTGESIADPFVPTADARILLADRADLLRRSDRGRPPRRPRFFRRRDRAARRKRATHPRGIRAGSPPGPAVRMTYRPPKAY